MLVYVHRFLILNREPELRINSDMAAPRLNKTTKAFNEAKKGPSSNLRVGIKYAQTK